ncbi:hypothetical protein AGABI1DRAFT_110034 [Agaricus bisporus var. burnettii JB137-S8]|uniref:FAD dependent oxidoreductase domain-containing protein n=1 Tax=Agaricus bisporus var. burnettii (strain JB137-S8 / ATCC MYA-4627 / FGSC 10392) TaxID=597362 RepID=K5XJ48_AGABU|nr:uncharacterized protein AGABI1DRAFT_110034 [Agaricus bisporus var. burnettii JB137-S8]EKM83367.1 hypothetical protein AGABI1DRAFT_110034 [Agaricus bisporus var. burnettii JB137-S8]
MLEARDTCSGATGRNGGHITPVLYQDYSELKKKHGAEVAGEIVRFRLSHLNELLTVASEEKLLEESQCRETRAYDVYQNQSLYRNAKKLLEVFKRDLPVEGSEMEIVEDRAVLQELQLAPSVVGCVASRGGAVHPYRLVTGILERLLKRYPSRFHLLTHTPCTSIEDAEGGYAVKTPRGEIRARQVVHATNAWVSHLLPGLRGKVIPVRAVMTVQMPEEKWTEAGSRSFVMYSGSSYMVFDYLTQQPSGELMMGGGFFRHHAHLTEIGNADDRGWHGKVAAYLGTTQYFRRSAGVTGVWGGIMAVSADGQPWVGRVPGAISGRAGAGEWVAAGYSGEGMVHAWGCGRAVGAEMGGREERVPRVFRAWEK